MVLCAEDLFKGFNIKSRILYRLNQHKPHHGTRFFYAGLSPLFYAYFDCLAGMTWRQIGRYLGMGWYIASLSSSVQSAYNVFTADFYQKLDFFVEILLEWMHHFFHNTGIVCLLPQISQIFINFPTVYLKRRRRLKTTKINIALFVILLEGLW